MWRQCAVLLEGPHLASTFMDTNESACVMGVTLLKVFAPLHGGGYLTAHHGLFFVYFLQLQAERGFAKEASVYFPYLDSVLFHTVHYATLPFHHSAILPFRHSSIPPFCHSAIPPFHHSAIPPFHHSAILLFRHSVIPPFRHSAIPPFRHSAIPPFRSNTQ
jgi:hypothetical protein